MYIYAACNTREREKENLQEVFSRSAFKCKNRWSSIEKHTHTQDGELLIAPLTRNRNLAATSFHSSLNDVSIINGPHSVVSIAKELHIRPRSADFVVQNKQKTTRGLYSLPSSGSVERELFCVFKISIVFGSGEIGLGIDSEGVSEVLSQCLHRSRRVVYKTDVLRRIFVRSFDLWNWQIFALVG